MTTPYVGEIRLFSFPRIPSGWFACDGSLKPISEYEVLYVLLGTTYGGDGVTTFAVPDLRGQVPVHMGTGPGLSNRVIGQRSGSESVTLLPTQLPLHTHPFNVNSTLATANVPATNLMLTAPSNNDKMYTSDLTGLTAYALAPAATGATGGNLPHENTMPTLTASFCIAWAGIFPSQQ
ncbi:phage tail protein [Janthinobacterium sp. NFX145]|uniref:phage tail protein n=1 Tax=unclassified Janthinobacterium TaxID=2610881 RepID=UPI00055FD3C8|nr:tail fiber protein [Janthinobacterium sp. RA13]